MDKLQELLDGAPQELIDAISNSTANFNFDAFITLHQLSKVQHEGNPEAKEGMEQIIVRNMTNMHEILEQFPHSRTMASKYRIIYKAIEENYPILLEEILPPIGTTIPPYN